MYILFVSRLWLGKDEKPGSETRQGFGHRVCFIVFDLVPCVLVDVIHGHFCNGRGSNARVYGPFLEEFCAFFLDQL